MSLRSWRGFLPEKTVVMVRRRAASTAPVESVVEPVQSIVRNTFVPQLSSVPQMSSIATPAAKIAAPGVMPQVLVFLETAPQTADHELLTKMMAAIGVAESQFVVECGDFPETKATIALGMGLTPRKWGRLSAFRPDAIELPGLDVIQKDAEAKRLSWNKLKPLSLRLAKK